MLHQNITLFPQGTGKRERVCWGFPGSSVVKNPPTMQETQVQTLDWEDPMEKGVDTHSSILFIFFIFSTPTVLPGEFHGQRSLVGYSS